MNLFPYTFDNKRYQTFNYFLKTKYGCKVAKVSLNAGFTCPNRDGTKGTGGCIFCSSSGSGDFAGNVQDSLLKQYEEVKKIMANKWKDAKYIAYFQANTNTYGPLSKIQEMIEPFLHLDEVVAITIATRADCLEQKTVEYLAEINKIKDVYIELGLQTIHDTTAKFINRGHTFDDFKDGLALLNQYHLPVTVHLINGLPFETREMMIESAKEVGKLNIHSLKIHNLYVIEGTKLADMYKHHEFTMLEREEYIDIVTQQLRYIPEHIVIERLTGDGKIDDLLAPLWSIKKVTIINDIDKKMKSSDIYQGDLCK